MILLNALYGADAPHPLMGHGSHMEDPAHPGQLNPSVGAYRCNTAESLLAGWNRNMPIDDINSWRDPAVAEAYVQAAMASDPQTKSHNPPCFRSPNGAMEKLQHDLVHAPSVKIVGLPDATHFVHLDRPERGRQQLLEEIGNFLAVTDFH